jgi:hypothetical protein
MTLAHWIYLLGTIVVIFAMIFRRNVVVPTILATLALGWAYKGDFVFGVETIFNAGLYAATQLFNIFLVIAIMVAMLKALSATKADQLMVGPIQKLMVNPTIAYLVLIVATFLISIFFWPSPSLPLVGALLIPPAVRIGLSPMTSAIAVAIAGQGMALASDFVIQGAPKITAQAANVPIESVRIKATILSIIVGVISLAIAYFMQRKEDKAFQETPLEVRAKAAGMLSGQEVAATAEAALPREGSSRKWLAFLVPLVLILVIVIMYAKDLKGGDATSLIGGAGLVLLLIAGFTYSKGKALEDISDFFVDGFIFAFRAMGPVIPIAGFFFLGSPDGASTILGKGAPGFLFDMATSLGHALPPGSALATFGVLLLGIITGIDGSGFAGLPLVGATAGALGAGHADAVSMMGAVGQIGSVYTGGGTLTPWSTLVAVAGIAGVSVLDLAKKNFIPVVIGMIVATIFALIVW